MTIKEFYDWAIENGVENCEFGVSLDEDEVLEEYYNPTSDDYSRRLVDDGCYELGKPEVGKYYNNGRADRTYVWLDWDKPNN